MSSTSLTAELFLCLDIQNHNQLYSPQGICLLFHFALNKDILKINKELLGILFSCIYVYIHCFYTEQLSLFILRKHKAEISEEQG